MRVKPTWSRTSDASARSSARHTTRLTTLEAWSDERGNRILYDGRLDEKVKLAFSGSNNTLVVEQGARLGSLTVDFNCDNGRLSIGRSEGVPAFSAAIRVGQDAQVVIGHDVSTTTTVAMSAVEGARLRVGDDVMIASGVQVRCDDGHPIFDVRTGRRVNPARDIVIGDHVWIGLGAMLLGGASLGSGSVVGAGSVVTGRFPNNCVVAGVPARLVRRDVAWERPHLSLERPYYKPDATTVRKSPYWALTDEHPESPLRPRARRRGWSSSRESRP